MKVNFANIPHELVNRNQWLVWRYEDKGGKRLTKVPYQPNGQYAKSNDPATWSDLQLCRKAYEIGQFDGIGFCFAKGDNLMGIDLDHCLVEDKPKSWAQEILEDFPGAYVERSPGGEGLHIWCTGVPIRTGSKKWKNDDGIAEGIEIYIHTSPRYLTVTGDQFKF